MTLAEVCDWYIEEAEADRLLGRNRRPIKPSTITSGKGRITRRQRCIVDLGARLIRERL